LASKPGSLLASAEGLDQGEAEAIALAAGISADVLSIDEPGIGG
jgi:predicted nucleic acid-binding protein